jgi:hypothetical protein
MIKENSILDETQILNDLPVKRDEFCYCETPVTFWLSLRCQVCGKLHRVLSKTHEAD